MKKIFLTLFLLSLGVLSGCAEDAINDRYSGSYPVSYSGKGGAMYYFCLDGECDSCYGDGVNFTVDLLNDKNRTVNMTLTGPCFFIGTTGLCESRGDECSYRLSGNYSDKENRYYLKSANDGLYSCTGDSLYDDTSLLLKSISCKNKKGEKELEIGNNPIQLPIRK